MAKVALITGGAKGIGRAIVKEFASLGYCVVVNYKTSEAHAKTLKEHLDKMGAKSLFVKADISNEQDVNFLVKEAIKEFGTINVLVNNAAVSLDSMFYEKSKESFLKTLNTNVIGTFLLSKSVGEIMYNSKSGKIINLSSTNGINTYYPMCLEYDASKAAIISLTHNLAVQFAPYVNVNAVAPGFIATESEVEGMDEDFIKLEEEKVLVHRAGKPEEVAKLVCFLASENANFINNEVIKIDGGIYGNC